MTIATFAFLAAAALQQAAPATPINFVEGFETGRNTGRWSFFGNPDNTVETIEPSGGRPGAWWHSTCGGLNCLDTFAPSFRTEEGTSSVFTGDYRGRGVRALGIDAAVLGPQFVSTGDRPLTLMLRHDPGTPDEFSDDVIVFRRGANIPELGQWRTYRYQVPSQSTSLPANWFVQQGSGDEDADWNLVMSDVDQVTFFFGDPEFFYIFQQWELGVDDIRIRWTNP
jgi:hypothetical protein